MSRAGPADGALLVAGVELVADPAGAVYWPEQRLLKKEMRRGQSCSVLESIDPHPAANGYSKVVSWIDIDSNGIIHADAYDAQGRLVKVFEPSEFRKVRGQWQLQEMEIRNVQTGSRTRIEFDPGSK